MVPSTQFSKCFPTNQRAVNRQPGYRTNKPHLSKMRICNNNNNSNVNMLNITIITIALQHFVEPHKKIVLAEPHFYKLKIVKM